MEDMNQYYVMQNKNLLITLEDSKKVLANGISMQDTRGRKDVVSGIVEASPKSLRIANRALAWFPMYAALPIILDGKSFVIVNMDDIIMTERIEDCK